MSLGVATILYAFVTHGWIHLSMGRVDQWVRSGVWVELGNRPNRGISILFGVLYLGVVILFLGRCDPIRHVAALLHDMDDQRRPRRDPADKKDAFFSIEHHEMEGLHVAQTHGAWSGESAVSARQRGTR
jgi:hypothetical protein